MSTSTVLSRNLTIYLIKEAFTAPERVVAGSRTLERYEFQIGEATGMLFVGPSFAHKPAWLSLFAGFVDLNELSNKSTAAVFVIRSSSRLFALTFGYGKHLLDVGSFEEGFGLRTTLGAINPDSIRVLDKTTFDAIAQHSKQQATRGASVREFGLDVEQDIVQAVTGVPIDATLGSRMSGKDALVMTLKCDLLRVPGLLKRLLNIYESREYRHNFDYIDQVDEIRDKTLREELDNELVERLRTGNLDNLWLAIPEIVEWSDFGGFKYSQNPRADTYEDVDMESFLASIRNQKTIRLGTLRQRHVYMYGEASGHVITQWPVYRCVYFEFARANETFLLSDGTWYRINRDFVTEIRRKFAAVPRAALILPPYSDSSEAAYNSRIASTDATFALMDRDLIAYGGGRNSIEFCDLYSKQKRIIHVKRYGGSRVFSHLFAQGMVSAQLFYSDGAFRKEVNRRLPTTHKIADPVTPPDPKEYEVIFAIISDAEGALEIPFFSMINLVNAAQRIRAFGYSVYLLKIAVEGPAN